MAKKKTTSKRKTKRTMSRRRKKKSVLPSIEVLIVLVFLASFIIWAVTRCNATKELYELREKLGEDGIAANLADDGTSTTTVAAPATASTTPATTTTTTPPPVVQQQAAQPAIYTRLYISIDSLNMRRGPSRDSVIITKLRLNDEVYFLNDVTDFQEAIFVEGQMEKKPWVKIRSRQGQIGWVYGAGVNYYRENKSFGQ